MEGNGGNERNRREKIRARGGPAGAAAAKGRERNGSGKGRKSRKRKREEEYGSKRATRYARAPLPGLYGNVGQIYHSGLTVQFSYLPRAACRSTPNHPRALQGRTGVAVVVAVVNARELAWRTWGKRRIAGVEAPDRGSANTSWHPLPPTSPSHNLHFPSNLP